MRTGIVLGILALLFGLAGAVELGTARAVKRRARDVAADTNARRMDPWNAPLGAPVEGAVLNDGWRDLREVPPPVNIDGGWTDSVMVTRNGRKLYYGYARYDFWQFYFSVTTPTPAGVQLLPSGPFRPGLTGDAFKIFTADLRPRGWEEGLHPVNGDSALSEASAAVNESENVVVFTRFPTGLPRGLYYSTRNVDGWSFPSPVPGVNSACDDDNGFVVGDLARGATFYFESTRLDPSGSVCGGQRHLFRLHFPPGGPPGTIGPVPGLTGGDDSQPFVTPDQGRIYWTGIRDGQYGVFTAERSFNGDYVNIHPVVTGATAPPFTGRLVLIGEANVADVPQGELMYLMCGVARSESGGHPTDIQLKVCQARRPR